MFGNEAVPLWAWPWLLAGGALFFLVVEVEKAVIRSSAPLRAAVVAIEAGQDQLGELGAAPGA
jgi:hypothetical protein